MKTFQKKSMRLNLLYLITGCTMLLFMGGKWNIPVLTWFGSIFILRYFRQQRGFQWIIISLVFLLPASHLFFMGLAEQVQLWFKFMIAISYTLYILVPCLIDQWMYPKINNRLLATLVYPATVVVVEFLLSYIEQLGTILHWTGSMFSLKPLLQIIAVTGVWGPSFLVGWMASVLNMLWEEQFDLKKTRIPVLTFAGTLMVAVLAGSIRMLFFPPDAGTVKTGSVVVGFKKDNLFYSYDDAPEAFKLQHKEEYRRLTFQVQDELFAESERIMPSGIKILSWASGNAVVFAEDEANLIKRMQDFARKNQVYFFPSLLVLGDYKGPDENHVLAIRPDGQIEYDHYKGRSPNAGYYQGNQVEIIHTPYGRIASPICFEMEFHRFIRQAGKQGVDILIVPGDEPARGAAMMHTEISMLRAVENGCSMLRTTLEGLSMAIDYQGRELGRMNYYQTLKNRSMITEMPMKGLRTFYSQTGDFFAWLCILLLTSIIVGYKLKRF